MTRTTKGIVRGWGVFAFVLFGLALATGAARADETLLIYPSTPCVFHYDAARFEVVGPGDPRYDASVAVANTVLWDRDQGRIARGVHRAPRLQGFVPSADGTNFFETMANDFAVTIDGESAFARSWGNLYMRFLPTPVTTPVYLEVDGAPVPGLTARLDGLVAVTPVGDGTYSGSAAHVVRWSGGVSVRIVVFSDRNFNRAFDDGEIAWSIVASDNTVPVSETTWGRLKAFYR